MLYSNRELRFVPRQRCSCPGDGALHRAFDVHRDEIRACRLRSELIDGAEAETVSVAPVGEPIRSFGVSRIESPPESPSISRNDWKKFRRMASSLPHGLSMTLLKVQPWSGCSAPTVVSRTEEQQ